MLYGVPVYKPIRKDGTAAGQGRRRTSSLMVSAADTAVGASVNTAKNPSPMIAVVDGNTVTERAEPTPP